MNLLPYSEFSEGREGCFLDVPAERYHAAPGVSRSQLDDIEPPALLAYNRTAKREVTIDMILGTLVHHRLLEPTEPFPQLAIKPDTYPGMDGKVPKDKPWNMNSHYCQQWVEAREAAGLIVLSKNEMAICDGCVNSFVNHRDPKWRDLIGDMFREGHSEVSCFKMLNVPFWLNGERRWKKLLVKCRIDWLRYGVPWIDDIKTARKGSTTVSELEFLADDYLLQPPSYTVIWNALNPDDQREEWVYWVVEKSPPFLLRPAHLRSDSNAMRLGREEYYRRLGIYAACVETGEWPAWPAQMVDVDLPKFRGRKLEEDLSV